jgi:hypothetical protein
MNRGEEAAAIEMSETMSECEEGGGDGVREGGEEDYGKRQGKSRPAAVGVMVPLEPSAVQCFTRRR